MNVTWEMIAGVAAILGAMFGGFKWIAGKFDRLFKTLSKLDKNKVSHKVCKERRAECPCIQIQKKREKK